MRRCSLVVSSCARRVADVLAGSLSRPLLKRRTRAASPDITRHLLRWQRNSRINRLATEVGLALGHAECRGVCRINRNARKNCGACGTMCRGNQACVQRECVAEPKGKGKNEGSADPSDRIQTGECLYAHCPWVQSASLLIDGRQFSRDGANTCTQAAIWPSSLERCS